MIQTGLERILKEESHLLQGKKIGIVMNHTSVDNDLVLSLDRLIEMNVQVQAVFAPEHGFRGKISAEKPVPDEKDPITGIPIYSLYGGNTKPTLEMLKGIDTLVFDIQDLGVRFYTYIYTLAECLIAAKGVGVEFIVLDRPNPINGVRVKGNLVEPNFQSYVGKYNLPIRHGMTIGELAVYFNREFNIGADLKVVKMKGWKRDFWYDDTELHWVMPSPNATGKAMTAIYPGTCFFEGTNVSEGRGTAAPFETIGAPWIDSYTLSEELHASFFLKGAKFRPITFTPSQSKFRGQSCNGIQIHVESFIDFEPIEAAFAIIDAIKKLYPSYFRWKKLDGGKFYFDYLCGTDECRKFVDEGKSLVEWIRGKHSESQLFEMKRKSYLLYENTIGSTIT